MSLTFEESVFKNKLTTQWLGHDFTYFEELESTNTYVKKIPAENVRQGMLCLTDYQTQGRGQYERRWETEQGKNLTFSLAFVPTSTKRFHVLTLACALALVEQLNEMFNSHCACISWPNDVLLNGKKMSGLLTETLFTGNNFDRLVIGIGININQHEFSPELKGSATSVSLEMGQEVGREQFLAELLSRIEYKYNLWQRRQGELLKSINRNIKGYGQWVGLVIDDELQDRTYKLLGIDENGQLLMLNQDAGIEEFSYEQIRLVTD
ncbi:MAG: biotin--[acetyl-CoA-carboxylase] ligase [Fodinibius sp.]|nr:biotin--[acetyl-CoA-carboxylase] ligase [Fodinibius sp.]